MVTTAEVGIAAATFVPAPLGGIKRGLVAKLGEVVSVKDFGATGDGTTDDTTAFQAALTATCSTSATYPMAGSPRGLHVPVGTYIINAPLNVRTGNRLKGEGQRSLIKTGGSFVGTKLFNLFAPAGYCTNVLFSGLGIESADSINAIELAAGTTLLNSTLEDMLFKSVYGIIIEGYTQENLLRRLTFTGANQRLIKWRGNANTFQDIHREGGDGTVIGNNTDPLIHLMEHSGGNSYLLHITNLVLEGYNGATNKPALVGHSFDDLTIQGYHFEGSGDGNVASFDGCANIKFKGQLGIGIASTSKLVLANASICSIEYLSTNTQDLPYTDWLSIDSTSFLRIEHLKARRWSNHRSQGNILVEYQAASSGTPLSPPIMRNRTPNAGQNLLANPSFEAGIYGWTIAPSLTPSFILSEIRPPGLMASLLASLTSANQGILQQFNLSAYELNEWFTFSAWAKVVGINGITGSNVAYAMVNSISTTDALYSSAESVCKMNTGWHQLSVTFRLAAAASWQFGIATTCADAASGNVTIYTDDMCLTPGTEPAGGCLNVKQVELNAASITTAAAIPTTGTWKRGDIVYNSTPSASGTPGWVCTIAGTPGTWKAMANLAA